MNQSDERKGCTPRMRKQICFRLTLPLYSVEFIILVTMTTLALDTTLRNCIIQRDMLHWRHYMFKFSGKQRILEVYANEWGILFVEEQNVAAPVVTWFCLDLSDLEVVPWLDLTLWNFWNWVLNVLCVKRTRKQHNWKIHLTWVPWDLRRMKWRTFPVELCALFCA